MGRGAAGRDHRAARHAGLPAGRRRSTRLSPRQPTRVFVALNLPDGVRQALHRAAEPLRERGYPVKWVRPDAMHLTLKFLGDVDDAQEPALRTALLRAAGAAGESRGVTLHIEGFGVFPDAKRPRVVWAGIAPEPALELLQDRVERAFAPLGFPTEARAFRPHLTLGRATRDARPRDFAGLEDALDAVAFAETVLVGDLDLMRSTLQPSGAVYQVAHRERLS